MFQDYSANRGVFAADAPLTLEVSRLISRYPNISEVETARLINLYRALPARQVAQMISDDRLAPRLDRFVTDHKSNFEVPFRQYAVLIGIALAGLAVAMWALAG